MEFHEKLQELRKQKGMTQEEVAQALFVSRTAVSKWESGRGYPGIDSLKEIAKFFSVTVDELLSSDELLTIAQDESKQKEKTQRSLIFGLFDISALIFFFLPFFSQKTNGLIEEVSLLLANGISPYLKAVYCVTVIIISLYGILTLALQSCQTHLWIKSKEKISLLLNSALLLLFIITSQVYAAALTFVFLAIKALMLIKWQ